MPDSFDPRHRQPEAFPPSNPQLDAPVVDTPHPPEVVATPVGVKFGDAAEERWWTPTWGETARQIGWRWIFVSPALLLILFIYLEWRHRFLGGALVVPAMKLAIFVVGITISLMTFAVRKIARGRAEPFCIHCGYNLRGLPDNHHCPECGHPYNWKVIEEYRRDPEWFKQRWRAQHKLPNPDAVFAAGALKRKRRARDGTE